MINFFSQKPICGWVSLYSIVQVLVYFGLSFAVKLYYINLFQNVTTVSKRSKGRTFGLILYDKCVMVSAFNELCLFLEKRNSIFYACFACSAQIIIILICKVAIIFPIKSFEFILGNRSFCNTISIKCTVCNEKSIFQITRNQNYEIRHLLNNNQTNFLLPKPKQFFNKTY